MKQNSEDIIITKTGEMAKAKKQAVKTSTSKNHSWCQVWRIDSQQKKLYRDTYSEGGLYASGPCGNFWYSGKLTILDAMIKHSESVWISKNANRLLATQKEC